MKKSIRLFALLLFVGALISAVCYLSFRVIEQSIIEEHEALVHQMAQSVMPALLAGDVQQVEALLKGLESKPGIKSAELISGNGLPLASYTREGLAVDLDQAFALASAENSMDLNVMAPLTFDTQILANLYIAIDLWPAYLRVIQLLGVLLIVPAILFVVIKQMQIRLRVEKVLEFDDSDSNQQFNIHNELKQALKASDISLEYRTIKRLSDQGIFGAELVVCWRRPSGETQYVSPADFTALANIYSSLLPIEEWVLEHACKQFSTWQQQYGPLILVMNISSDQFTDPCFYDRVRLTCASAQLPHQLIEFEINEAFLLCSNTATKDIDAFVQRGLNLTVDNFGLSLLSHDILKNTAIQKVKFSRQLVKNMMADVDVFSHIRSCAALALDNDVQLMVDGLQSKEQITMAQEMGVLFGQGAEIGLALSAQKFEDLLASQRRVEVAPHGICDKSLSNVSLSY